MFLVLYDAEKSYVNAGMPEKKLVRHRHFYRQSTSSVRHRHSGIKVSPVPLVTDSPALPAQLMLSTDLPHVFARVSPCLCLPTFQLLFLRYILILERYSDELLRETEQFTMYILYQMVSELSTKK
jgi:hypothetical protein